MVVLMDLARTIFEQSLEDCSIERAFAAKLKTHGDAMLLLGEHAVDFSKVKHLRIFAAGKASASMLSSLLKRLPLTGQYEISGVVIGTTPAQTPVISAFAGGHPLPNEASFAGAQTVLQMLRDLPKGAAEDNTLCLFLISGGASAMMELPLDSNITLTETIAFHRALVHSGASISEINCVRKHFSAVKGGRLAKAAGRAACLSILLSDVPPGYLDTIGSGPTLPDTSTIEECREILSHYQILEQCSASVRAFFLSANVPETIKPGELLARTWTILNADDLAKAAKQRAESLGFYTVVDNTCDDWDYRAAAEYLLKRVHALQHGQRRVCLLSVGEVIVRPSESRDHAWRLFPATADAISTSLSTWPYCWRIAIRR